MSADWIKTAKVGDKVVCVDAHTGAWARGQYAYPDEFAVYTIRAVVVFEGIGEVALHLAEIVNPADFPWRGDFVEPAFNVSHFRPVHPRKTDISIFTDMLKTADQPVEELA